jgi:hypothetical protein
MPTATQSLPESAVAFYELGQRYSAAGVLTVRSLWQRMSIDNLDRTWASIAPDALRTLATLQTASARDASTYVATVLDEQGMSAPAVATVQPLAFARGSSGLPLSEVLATVPAAVKTAIGNGSRDMALPRGLALLEGITETHIADAARLGTAAAFVARPDVKTWVRVLNPPSCGRCAVMAGHVYHWNATFQRHPRCDCRTVPSTSEGRSRRMTFDPRAYFDGLSAAEQDKHFGKAVAEEIRNGGDLVKAVNTPRDAWRVRLAEERKADAPRWGSASGATTATTPQTFMESLTQQVERKQAIRNLADSGFLAAA